MCAGAAAKPADDAAARVLRARPVDGARLAGLVVGEARLAVFTGLAVFTKLVARLAVAVLAVTIFAGLAAVAVFAVEALLAGFAAVGESFGDGPLGNGDLHSEITGRLRQVITSHAA